MTLDAANLLSRPLDKFRFGTQLNETSFSNIWFAHQRQNDFYLGARNQPYANQITRGRTKVSFHSLGTCHIKTVDQAGEHTRLCWRRPPTPSTGAVHVASVHFPTDLTRSWGHLTLKPNKIAMIVSAARSGGDVEFAFFYSMEPQEQIDERLRKIGIPLVQIDFPSGEYVHVAIRYAEYTNWVSPVASWSIPSDVSSELVDGAKIENISALSWNNVEDGGCLHITNIQGFVLPTS